MKKILLATLTILFFSLGEALAQRMAVKSNALAWLTLSPNVGADIVLSPKTSLSMEGSFNLWDATPYCAKHTKLSVDSRYWLDRPLIGHSFGVGVTMGSYDLNLFGFELDESRFTIGARYGYTYILNERMNIEGLIGFGVGAINERTIDPATGSYRRSNRIDGVVDQLSISFVYIIR